MTINLNIAGVSYPHPSGAADVNWAAQQIAVLQALAAAMPSGPALQRLSTNVTPAGTGADTTEDTLMSYTLPGGTLGANGKGIRITAAGTGVNTADATTVRAYFGASLLQTRILTAGQNNKWLFVIELFRTGPTAQFGSTRVINGGGAAGVVQQDIVGPTETLANDIIIKFTGQRAVSSVANSLQQVLQLVELIP